mgnify:CR=1 FL=1|tara:strand:+ start:2055 stop:2957 length:903 start_codon:yes stop_codon:yes gene_type:complete
MKYQHSIPLFFLWLSLALNPAHSEVLFVDSFESRDLSTSTAETNSINFQWTSANRTGVITQELDSGKRVFPTQYERYFNDGQDWTAMDGTHSLSVEYGANGNMAEQRFAFDTQTNLWLRFWVKVPHNFVHGTMNNKFFSIWGSTYDAAGTLTLETRPTSGGSSQIYMKDGGFLSPDEGNTPFINASTDLGKWMQVVIHVKNGSSVGAADGIIELYRRWEGEAQFTKLLDKKNATGLWEPGELGFRAGYLMGWANDAFDSDTYWLIDKFEMANASLLNVVDPINKDNPALPPNNLSGKKLN